MAETFKFGISSPGVGEVAVDRVRCYESADGSTGWAQVDEILVSALDPAVADIYTWASALADVANYHQLVPVSVDGVERAGANIIPPRPSNPGSFTLYCHAIDAGVTAKSGIVFSAIPQTEAGYAISDPKLVFGGATTTSDAQGYMALLLPADAGVMEITLDTLLFDIDTAGRSGQVINLVDLI